nr:glutamine synthetase [Actinomycetota bacterium]
DRPVEDNLFLLSAQDIAEQGIQHLPRRLDCAIDELVTDEVLRTALGKVHDGDFIDYYAKVKSAEVDEYHSTVSHWEVERYLTLTLPGA